MSNSLTKSNTSDSEEENDPTAVHILNSLSKDLSMMRKSLLNSGLESLSYNINRQNSSLRFYEFGNTYHYYNGQYQEDKELAIFITGSKSKESWIAPQSTSDFFFLKGIVTGILGRLGITKTKVKPSKSDALNEGISIYGDNGMLVELGTVNGATLKSFGIKQEVLYANFKWDNLLKETSFENKSIQPLPKHPFVRRDLALLVNKEVQFKDIYQLAYQAERNVLKEVDLFDVYEGDKLPEDKKSYAVSFILQDDSKTLNDKQIERIMNKLQLTFEKNLEATLR